MTGVKERGALWCFIAILAVQTLFMIYIGSLKQGFFVDEIFSYTDSNSFFKPRAREYQAENAWVDMELAQKLLTVDPDHRFRIDSAYKSQVKNTHPPLHYFCMNVISSLFPGTFSKWYGIFINLVCFEITAVFLYLISRKLMANQWTALFPVLFFGFSTAAGTMVNYIRMYYLMTAIGMVYLFIQLFMLKEPDKKRYLIFNTLTIFFGSFTHYYFMVFAFFMCGLYIIRYLCRKEGKAALLHAVSSALGVGLSIAAFPATINQLFFRSRGVQSVEKMKSFSGWGEEIQMLWDLIDNGLFADKFIWVFLLICLSLLGGLVYYLRLSKNRENLSGNAREALKDVHLQYMLILTGTIGLYIVFISHIVPFFSDRYIMNLYPIIPLVCLFFMDYLKVSKKHIPVCSILLLVVCLALNANYISMGKMKYRYSSEVERRQIVQEYEGYASVFAIERPFTLHELLQDIDNYQCVYYMTNIDDLKQVDDILKEQRDDDRGFVLYLETGIDEEKALEDIMSTGAYAGSTYLFETPTYFKGYFIEGA